MVIRGTVTLGARTLPDLARALRRVTLLVVVAAVACAASCLPGPQGGAAPPPATGPGGDFVTNGGFEDAADGAPAGWNIEAAAAAKGQIALVPQRGRSGSTCLSLRPSAANTSIELTDNPLGVGQGFAGAGLRGRRLHFSAWMGAEGGATAVTYLAVLYRSGRLVGEKLEQPSGGDALARQEGLLEVPDASDLTAVVLLCLVEGTSGAAYFDDVKVTTEIPAEWRPEGGDRGGGASLAATVSVDASREVRRIPREIYGSNIAWIWDGSGVWEGEKDRLRPEVASHSRDLGVSLIRFPGGILADFYHWKDGVGPRGERASTPHTPGGPSSVHRFGTDEALAFAKEVGGSLMITVNVATGTPQEAADWVRYVNGKPGQRVVWWEIGNENYVRSDAAHAEAAGFAPAEYAQRVVAFARAMRAADAGIRIGAIGDENYGRAPDYHPDWTETVLRVAGREIDFIAVHNAYAPALWEEAGLTTRQVYDAMLAAPTLIRRSLDEVAEKIARHGPAGRPIGIAVTEWGPYFSADVKSRFVDHVKTLGSALFVASTLKAFVETPALEAANFYALVDPLYMGWIGPRGGDGPYAPKAPYYAVQMYARHFGSRLVASSVEGPAMSTSAVGWVSAMRDVPYLEVVCARSDDGRRLFVLAINRHYDRAIDARVALVGFAPTGGGTAWTLTGAGLDAHTGTAPFRAPGVQWGRQAGDEANPRIDRGGPGEIEMRSAPLAGVAASFTYAFPPRSVTSLEIEGR